VAQSVRLLLRWGCHGVKQPAEHRHACA
jgi:hypothetical protein